MTARRRFRDVFQAWTPVWLSDRGGQFAGATVGYRMLWVLHAAIDKVVEGMLQAFLMALPGYGSPSALGLIGQSRGLLRGKSDTNADFAARLRAWRTKAQLGGTRVGIATYLHEYLPGRPQVDVVNRAGSWTRVNSDGSVTQYRNTGWNWDGTSNPERSGDWSDLWIIVAGTYAIRTGTIGGLAAYTTQQRSTMALGMTCPQSDVQDVLSILRQVKSAKSRIREVIWNYDLTVFDPTKPSSLPAGQAGTWGTFYGGHYEPNTYGRTILNQRYWEPN